MNRSIREELRSVFYPRSMALVGISSNAVNVGYMFLHTLLEVGFTSVYPVNPKGGEMLGRKVYESIKDIPDEIDLALLTVPREAIPDIARECAEKRVKAIVLYSGGFSESGSEGKSFEKEIVEICRASGTRVIGPNGMGPYNPLAKLIPHLILPKESGSVGIISHSGFLFYYLVLSAADRGLLPSRGVSCGTDADLTCVDFIEYLGQDPETKMIIAYLEGIRDGRLVQVAREVSLQKPIIVLKGGNSEAGIKASASHTGTLAVSAAIWKTLCAQTGIIAVDTFEQMMDVMLAFHHLKRPAGKRVGIITTPGGLAVTSTDACSQLGLEVPGFTDGTRKQLTGVVESIGTSVNNPVDLGPIGALDPERYMLKAISIVAKDPNIDMILSAFTGPPFDDDDRDSRIADMLLDVIAAGGKPTVICGAIPTGWPRGELRFLDKRNVPVYPEPRRAAYALARLTEYADFLRNAKS